MKGIRKLFLGLFFMTLFSVGFKVDVSAASSATLSVNNDGTTTVSFTPDGNDYPTGQGVKDIVCTLKDANGEEIESVTVKLKTIDDGGTSKYQIGYGNNAFSPDPAGPTKPVASINIIELTSDDVRSHIKEGELEVSLYVDDDFIVKSPSIKAYKVEVNTINATDITYSGLPDPPYVFQGETKSGTITSSSFANANLAANGSLSAYRWNSWTNPSKGTVTDNTTTTSSSASGTYSITSPSEDQEIKANFVKVGLSSNLPSTVKKDVAVTVTLNATGTTKAYSANEIDGITFTESGPNVIPVTKPTTLNNGTITFTPTTIGSGKLSIKMNDGNVFNSSTVVIGDITVNPVKVTMGRKIPLSYFTSSSNEVIARQINGYVSVDPSTASTNPLQPSQIKIVGGSSAVTEQNGLIVNEDTNNPIKVTVYSHPRIELASSGSSSSGSISIGSDSKSTNSSARAFTIYMPAGVYHDDGGTAVKWDKVTYAQVKFKSKESGKEVTDSSFSIGTSSGEQSKSVSVKDLTPILKKICEGGTDYVTVTVSPKELEGSTPDTSESVSREIKVYKIKLDRSENATYTVKCDNTEIISSSDTTEYFYAIDGLTYNIKSSAKSGTSGLKFDRWDNSGNKNWDTADGGDFDADDSKTFKAIYSNTSSSSPSSSSPSTTGRNAATEGMDDYDDVPKTGESKADIWILWSVLFVSILGAGFMIWKRFGLVRAIAEADEEVAVAEHKEEVKAKKKEKEDKIKMLKDLRNL